MIPLPLLFTFISLFSGARLEDNGILLKTISTLKTLKTIEYQHLSQRVDKNETKSSLDSAVCFFDFTAGDSLVGARYHFQSSFGEEVFNGTTEYNCHIQERRILFSNTPTKGHLGGSFWVRNSMLSLRSLLPQMMKDPSVVIVQQKDEVVDGRSYYKLTIELKNRRIRDGIDIVEQKGTVLEQELLIDKETYLPYSYRTIVPGNQGFQLVTFKHINTNASRPDNIWTYERYPAAFSRQTYEEFDAAEATKMTTKIGSMAPEWKLPMVDGDSASLSSQKGNLVLLEFWFPYCKGCVEAVPDINALQEKYKKNGLRVYGIETLNSSYDKLIRYIKKYNIEPPTLYNGKLVAREYEARVAPTFMLLDRKGRFVYIREGFDKEEIIKAIEGNL
ncbi:MULTISPECIES: TlpA disulfide reductase family protein [unclassified Imperialibacter]|uniref:TlpA family protein disulfide reductase n=1 Tax=unclassified Imperialibacter TaxID=2629706 RepID=UPI0012548EF5|nr:MULTISPECIES: TlpA disulfide reductase family protein [unclassified Imperialibacter]CAD5275943.1 putative TlpA family protein disulfide reductase [Imperialibacter sp. 75]CAD5293971.1 putative TlpA family protein disulfide reductase [Imperialibacter sp. 89]VVT12722.1 putative Peroxiredoxin [Imperialibacter sp. EC-SDR9]